jgi:hypothetical protein
MALKTGASTLILTVEYLTPQPAARINTNNKDSTDEV